MNREEFHVKLTALVEEAMEAEMYGLDVITCLESAKLALTMMLHERARHAGVLN